MLCSLIGRHRSAQLMDTVFRFYVTDLRYFDRLTSVIDQRGGDTVIRLYSHLDSTFDHAGALQPEIKSVSTGVRKSRRDQNCESDTSANNMRCRRGQVKRWECAAYILPQKCSISRVNYNFSGVDYNFRGVGLQFLRIRVLQACACVWGQGSWYTPPGASRLQLNLRPCWGRRSGRDNRRRRSFCLGNHSSAVIMVLQLPGRTGIISPC